MLLEIFKLTIQLVFHVLHFVSMSESLSMSILPFKCVKGNGTRPGIYPLIGRFKGTYLSSKPTAVGLSAVQCASLCARTPFQACQSYAYNFQTTYCFTQNIRTSHVGDLCGINLGQSQARCQKMGNTMMAYGENTGLMECICGGDSRWPPGNASNKPDLCPGLCSNPYPCAINVGILGGCRICNGTLGDCGSLPLSGTSFRRVTCLILPP